MSLKEAGMNSKGYFFSHHPCFIILYLFKVMIISTLSICDTPILKFYKLTFFLLLINSSWHLCGSYRVLALCWIRGHNDDGVMTMLRFRCEWASCENAQEAFGDASILSPPNCLEYSHQIRNRNHSSAPI